MKLLFLSREFPTWPGGGGIGSYVASVAPALVRRGHEVHVLCCEWNQPRRDESADGVFVHRRPLIRARGVRWLTGSMVVTERVLAGLTCLVEALRLGIPFDVVEIPDWMAEGWCFALLRPVALVAHLHTPSLHLKRHNGEPVTRHDRRADALERFAVNRADIVTSPSQLLVKDLTDEGWLGSAQVHIVRYPIDIERWAGVAPVDNTEPVVLAVGRVEPRKAPEVLVAAAEAIRDQVPGVRVRFVGRSSGHRDGLSYEDWLRRDVITDADLVTFVGERPRDELPQEYARSRVVAVPSYYDNFPMAALEAMAAGRAVVVTERVGAAEILRASGGGAVVPAGDPVALGMALLPYLRDPAAAHEAGDYARRRAVAECSPQTIAEQREGVYAEARRHWEVRRPFGRQLLARAAMHTLASAATAYAEVTTLAGSVGHFVRARVVARRTR